MVQDVGSFQGAEWHVARAFGPFVVIAIWKCGISTGYALDAYCGFIILKLTIKVDTSISS